MPSTPTAAAAGSSATPSPRSREPNPLPKSRDQQGVHANGCDQYPRGRGDLPNGRPGLLDLVQFVRVVIPEGGQREGFLRRQHD